MRAFYRLSGKAAARLGALAALMLTAACNEGVGTGNEAAGDAAPAVLSTWETVMTQIRNCDQAHERMVSTAQLAESGSGSEQAMREALDAAEQTCAAGVERIAALDPPGGAGTDNQVGFGAALDNCEAAERTRLRVYPLLRQMIDETLEDESQLTALGEEHQEKSRLCGFSYAQQADEAGVDTEELERVSERVLAGRGGS